jgi:hypothetical protein
MVLPPALGGFGLLPLREHVRARQAVLAVRGLLALSGHLAPATPAWAGVAAALLATSHRHARPLSLLPSADRRILGRAPPPSACLKAIMDALRHLPPPQLVSPPPLGAWCVHTPLWSNPIFSSNGAPLHVAFPSLLLLPGLHTIGAALSILHSAGPALSPDRLQLPLPALLPFNAVTSGTLYRSILRSALGERLYPVGLRLPAAVRAIHTLNDVAALVAALPAPWVAAARAAFAQPPLPPVAATLHTLVAALGWPNGSHPVTLPRLTVRFATSLQLEASRTDVLAKHHAFLADAYAPAAPPPPAAAAFAATLRRAWQLPWEPRHKEPLWRLALNGFAAFPLHSRALASGQPPPVCPCGAAMLAGPRRHHFWDCPLAAALRAHLELAVAPARISRASLWLLRPPHGVAPPVWDVVCMAALAALELGRQQLYGNRVGPGAAASAAAGQVATSVAAVLADFWARLHSFASLGGPRPGWDAVPAVHPFLCGSPPGHVLLVPPADPAVFVGLALAEDPP